MNHHIKQTMAAGLLAAFLAGCASMSTSNTTSTITKADFGKTPDGTPVEIYTLRNSKGAEARIMTYGGIVQKLTMPDKNGKFADIVLGFDTLDGYTKPSYVKACPYFGALIGRYGNRIGGATVHARRPDLHAGQNNNGNSLHGGIKGFDKVVWTAVKADVGPDGPQLVLTYLSKDGEEGFPGNLNVTATYTLTDDNALKLELHRDDRQADRGEPHASFLFQPRRPGQRRHPRPPGLHQFRQDHAGGQRLDHDRRVCRRDRHAV